MSPARRPRWDLIRALVTDVDGVLTDDGLYHAEHGDELKRFDVRDGQGLVRLREAGRLIAVADAVPEVRRAATDVTRAKLGHGAIRELCDLILAADDHRRA